MARPERTQRRIQLATAVAVFAVAGALWLARPRPVELPPVYRDAVLEVTGLT